MVLLLHLFLALLRLNGLILNPLRPPSKGVLRKSSYNPNARAAQRYSIIEDLAQVPSTMFSMEVL